VSPVLHTDPILFLDIDGVLTIRKLLLTTDTGMSRDCLEQLERVIQATGCKIVISSSWRILGILYILDAILAALERPSPIISRSIIGQTPNRVKNSDVRGDEIRAWLDQRPGTVGKFVILDDETDMGDLLPHLLKTDIELGLTAELADQLIKRLTT
jgi:hypothetical protein